MFGANIHKWQRWSSRLFLTVLVIVLAFLCFLVLDLCFPLRVQVPYSTLMLDRNKQVLFAALAPDDRWRMLTEPDEIPDSLRNAFLYKEDQYFYSHPGVNPGAVMRAIWNNISKGKKTSGASTITMQVARLLEKRKRTYGNKIIEMFRALQLEKKYSKDEILALYFNLVPYGGNIEGVKAASVLYFDKLPSSLSLAELTILTIVPNRPTSLRPGKNNEVLKEARDLWLTRFKNAGIFSEEAINSALNEPIVLKRLPAPRKTPHLAYRLLRHYPEKKQHVTTIDQGVQARTEELVLNYSRRMATRQIYNAAVMVVDNHTKQVLAYVGSSDFGDNEHGGQIDGIRAVRSPGSTLKPLIYGMGMDEGLVTPKTTMADVPTDFGGFAPENFDETFHGKVTVETSLAFSLNIPAVKMLQQVTVPKAVDRLKKCGFRKLNAQTGYVGLSLALGGCGVTLEELTGLFSAFADKGKWQSLKYLKSDTSRLHYQVLSPASDFMITQILNQIERPDLPHHSESNFHVPKIAWKTGTSYGRKDAWSIGYNQRYTIGVWLGNFSGHGVHDLSGADIATPLLFQIFNTLDYNSSAEWFKAPPNLKTRYVCSETGLPAGEFCEHTTHDYFIPTVSPSSHCEHQKYFFVSSDEHYSYCMQCLPETGYKKKLYPVLPPDLANYYRVQKIPFAEVPEHNPKCLRISQDHAPEITSPLHKKEYLLEKADPSELALKCETQHQVREVFWYVNDKFIKKAAPAETVFYKPTAGKLKISCVDDQGRNSEINVTVRFY